MMKTKSKDNFILYNEFYEPIKLLNTSDKGLLLTAIFEYQVNGIEIDLPQTAKVIFSFIKQRLDYNNQKWAEKCEQNRENVRKRWNKDDTEQYDRIRKIRPNTNYTDTDTELDIDIDIDNETELGNKNVDNSGDNFQKTGFPIKFSIQKNQFQINSEFSLLGTGDPDFEIYKKEFGDEIIKDVEDWLIANKTGRIIDKSFICRQIVNFAKRQGKF